MTQLILSINCFHVFNIRSTFISSLHFFAADLFASQSEILRAVNNLTFDMWCLKKNQSAALQQGRYDNIINETIFHAQSSKRNMIVRLGETAVRCKPVINGSIINHDFLSVFVE